MYLMFSSSPAASTRKIFRHTLKGGDHQILSTWWKIRCIFKLIATFYLRWWIDISSVSIWNNIGMFYEDSAELKEKISRKIL